MPVGETDERCWRSGKKDDSVNIANPQPPDSGLDFSGDRVTSIGTGAHQGGRERSRYEQTWRRVLVCPCLPVLIPGAFKESMGWEIRGTPGTPGTSRCMHNWDVRGHAHWQQTTAAVRPNERQEVCTYELGGMPPINTDLWYMPRSLSVCS